MWSFWWLSGWGAGWWSGKDGGEGEGMSTPIFRFIWLSAGNFDYQQSGKWPGVSDCFTICTYFIIIGLYSSQWQTSGWRARQASSFVRVRRFYFTNCSPMKTHLQKKKIKIKIKWGERMTLQDCILGPLVFTLPNLSKFEWWSHRLRGQEGGRSYQAMALCPQEFSTRNFELVMIQWILGQIGWSMNK